MNPITTTQPVTSSSSLPTSTTAIIATPSSSSSSTSSQSSTSSTDTTTTTAAAAEVSNGGGFLDSISKGLGEWVDGGFWDNIQSFVLWFFFFLVVSYLIDMFFSETPQVSSPPSQSPTHQTVMDADPKRGSNRPRRSRAKPSSSLPPIEEIHEESPQERDGKREESSKQLQSSSDSNPNPVNKQSTPTIKDREKLEKNLAALETMIDEIGV